MKERPLHGRRIVITRARSQAEAFARALEELGGQVVEFPTIEILPPESYEPLDRAIQTIEGYDWIIFTSANGVNHFFSRWRALQRDIRVLEAIKIAAIGPETARQVQAIGARVELVPREYRAEAILQELRPGELRGKKIVLPRAAEARDILPRTLREWGAEVDVVEAYRTIPAKNDISRLHQELLQGEIDVITFTSSSTVKNFSGLFSGEDMKGLLSSSAVACIGPITKKKAEEAGIRVDVVAQEYTIPGLTRAIVEYFNRTE